MKNGKAAIKLVPDFDPATPVHQSEVNALLNQRHCVIWPECACAKNIAHWQAALEDKERIFEDEELVWAEEIIFLTCACVAEHCPDRKTRAYGARQVAELKRRRERIARATRQVEQRSCQ